MSEKKVLIGKLQLHFFFFASLMISSGLFPAILGKGLGHNWEKNDRFNIKIGRNNNIEHDTGSKIYPQNQVILDCIMPNIPLKHKSLKKSFFVFWVFFFTFLN